MSFSNLATTATSALWWYHLPSDGQYKGANVSLYEKIAKMGGRDDYAQIVAGTVHDVDGPLLEIGAGTGLVSRTLAEQHGDRLLCTDIDTAVLAFNPIYINESQTAVIYPSKTQVWRLSSAWACTDTSKARLSVTSGQR